MLERIDRKAPELPRIFDIDLKPQWRNPQLVGLPYEGHGHDTSGIRQLRSVAGINRVYREEGEE